MGWGWLQKWGKGGNFVGDFFWVFPVDPLKMILTR